MKIDGDVGKGWRLEGGGGVEWGVTPVTSLTGGTKYVMGYLENTTTKVLQHNLCL